MGLKWEIDVLQPPTKPTDDFVYRVQVRCISVEAKRLQGLQELEGKGYKPFIVKEKRVRINLVERLIAH